MNQETRATLEIIAPSVEEAIEKGLSELGLKREDVDVEILDEGKQGLFGLGGRQSRIRLTLKSADHTAEATVEEPVIESAPEADVEDYDLSDQEEENIGTGPDSALALRHHPGDRAGPTRPGQLGCDADDRPARHRDAGTEHHRHGASPGRIHHHQRRASARHDPDSQ